MRYLIKKTFFPAFIAVFAVLFYSGCSDNPVISGDDDSSLPVLETVKGHAETAPAAAAKMASEAPESILEKISSPEIIILWDVSDDYIEPAGADPYYDSGLFYTG
ncbi:MAG: hypothetical protein ACLFQK_07835 [Fibrobacterota bacterium]